MIGLYYRVWADLIKRARLQPNNKKNWPVMTMLFMTMAMAFNFLFITTIFEKYVLKTNLLQINLDFLSERINNVLTYLILFVLPCSVINYLLIFRNKRYQKLLAIYPYYNGKLFLVYFTFSMMFPIILLLGGIIYTKFK